MTSRFPLRPVDGVSSSAGGFWPQSRVSVCPACSAGRSGFISLPSGVSAVLLPLVRRSPFPAVWHAPRAGT